MHMRPQNAIQADILIINTFQKVQHSLVSSMTPYNTHKKTIYNPIIYIQTPQQLPPMLLKSVIFCMLLLVIVEQVTCRLGGDEIQSNIDWLYARLNKRYWKTDRKAGGLGQFQQIKGLYQSYVRVNYVDRKNGDFAALFRDKLFKIDDNNMFVTSFVLFGLLEAQQLGILKIDEHRFSQSLVALTKFQDKNLPPGIPQYNFWTQNISNGTWYAQPKNLMEAVAMLPNFPGPIAYLLDVMGLGMVIEAKYIAKAFTIPSDNDDSAVNLALLGIMKETNNSHYAFFNSLNTRKQQFYRRSLKYAYRPFSPHYPDNPHADQIDPRSYFILHKFLTQKHLRNQTLILPTTWLLHNGELVNNLLQMPYQVNNVDCSVAANFLFGLSYQVLLDEVTLDDELEQVMWNTAELLEYTVREVIEVRSNIALLYYPSKYDFFWFVARNLQLLKRYCSGERTCPEVLVRNKGILEAVMKKQGTEIILRNRKVDGNGDVYWREFLGNYAGKNRNEDSVFSTALALNALLDTWTTRNKSSVHYDPEVPSDVKTTLQQGIHYLQSQLNPNMKQFNAFFSGSTKNMYDTFPFFYPSNLNINGKGQVIDPNTATLYNISTNSSSTMKGYITDEQYQRMLGQKWYTYDVPAINADLNNGTGMLFPFWSAEPITQIMGILSLGKWMRVNGQGGISKGLLQQ